MPGGRAHIGLRSHFLRVPLVRAAAAGNFTRPLLPQPVARSPRGKISAPMIEIAFGIPAPAWPALIQRRRKNVNDHPPSAHPDIGSLRVGARDRQPHGQRPGSFPANLAHPFRQTRGAVHARGGIDGIGRIVGARLSEMWGQQVVVENKPGAGGNIASEFVARSAPDGYTMYITAGGLAVNRYLFGSINYDPVADFAPVTLICLFPNLLVVPNSSSFRSVSDLLAEARKNPGKVTFASPGHGSSPHMSGELFRYMANVDLTHVPYRGAAPAFTDVIAGRVDCTFAVMASGLPLAQSGQLRALGVTTADPRADGAGGAHHRRGRRSRLRHVILVRIFRAGQDAADIIRKMHADTVAALAEPAIKAKLDQLGVMVVGSTPEELGTHLKTEMEKWAPVIKAANIKVNE